MANALSHFTDHKSKTWSHKWHPRAQSQLVVNPWCYPKPSSSQLWASLLARVILHCSGMPCPWGQLQRPQRLLSIMISILWWGQWKMWYHQGDTWRLQIRTEPEGCGLASALWILPCLTAPVPLTESQEISLLTTHGKYLLSLGNGILKAVPACLALCWHRGRRSDDKCILL